MFSQRVSCKSIYVLTGSGVTFLNTILTGSLIYSVTERVADCHGIRIISEFMFIITVHVYTS